MSGNLKVYLQLERYIKIKEMMEDGVDLPTISRKVGVNYSYLHFNLSRKVLNMDMDDLRRRYNVALAEFSERKQKEVGKKAYKSAKPKAKKKPSKRVFYDENGVPVAYRGVFKTQEQYIKHLVELHSQGKI